MEQEVKFFRMIDLLRSNHQLRQRLLDDPENVLTELGIDESILNKAHDDKALARAQDLVTSAKLTDADDVISGLKKIGAAAKQNLKNGFEVEVEPFGVTLLERVPGSKSLDWTATATTKCTFSPWDGCKPDVDW